MPLGAIGWTQRRVYGFDATRICANRPNVEVTHAALPDRAGSALLYLSTNDQSGLSSLGRISNYQEILSVPCLRLEDFLKDRGVERIRLLKVDVEGSEQIVLSGLGSLLTDGIADFILIEL